MNTIFTPEFFQEHNYLMSVPNPEYPNNIVAHSQHVWNDDTNYPKSIKDKRMVRMNLENGYISIKEDWDTRTVFSGQVETKEQLSVILNCVR